jgi:hypothetical protein
VMATMTCTAHPSNGAQCDNDDGVCPTVAEPQRAALATCAWLDQGAQWPTVFVGDGATVVEGCTL